MGAYRNTDRIATQQRGSSRRHQRIGFDEFEFGIIKRRILEGKDETDDEWAEGHPVLFPNILLVGNEARATVPSSASPWTTPTPCTSPSTTTARRPAQAHRRRTSSPTATSR